MSTKNTPAEAPKMKRVNQFLPQDQIIALAKLAKQTKLPAAEHMRKALQQYLRRLKVL